MAREESALRGVVLDERRITAADFGKREGVTVFTYPFALDRPTILSLHVTHFGHTLDLDTATITKVER
jgi:hypothetical protein